MGVGTTAVVSRNIGLKNIGKASEAVKQSILLTIIIRLIIGFISFIFAIVFKFGLIGIWLAYSLDITIRGIILLLRFLKGSWKDIKID
ncbi:hypothetical protein bsdtw1_01905 [Clostridium fungisolvens]|uniref:Uncharacterized protein n=1 Tax=Clostridium fungisolvens TaxID=1604897 RepID=A0A6V8SLR3_9CLOT|nr:hypothetical protein bsdtw1_01905 [Clostridium fungisolvens]